MKLLYLIASLYMLLLDLMVKIVKKNSYSNYQLINLQSSHHIQHKVTQQLHFHLHWLNLDNKCSLQIDILLVSATSNITQIIVIIIIHILQLLSHSRTKPHLLEL